MERISSVPARTNSVDGKGNERLLQALQTWSDELSAATLRLRATLLASDVSQIVAADVSSLSPDARRERLRRWRRDEARRRGIAPYLVLTNGVLEKLAVMEVLGREDLRRVPGIGPRKLEAYGEAILNVLGG